MDATRKRLIFRANHRGMQETDRLLGGFAEERLGTLDEAQLARFEALLDQSDPDLLNWITGRAPVPAHLDHDVMVMLMAYAEDR